MRALSVLLLILMLVAACGGEKEKNASANKTENAPQGAAEVDKYGLPWKELVSEEGRFQIDMPGNPLFEIDTVTISAGSVLYPSYTTDTLGFYFMVGYSDMPDIYVQRSAPPVVLEGSCRGALSEVKGTLIKDTLAQVGDYWYRDYLVQLPDSARIMRIRSLMSGSRIFMMMVSTPAGDSANVLGRFVESFKIFQRLND